MMRGCLVLCLALACSWAAAQSLTVSAAASLADALREIAAAFEIERPGMHVRVNTAASGVLLQQIAQGAAVDVLVSADVATMERGIAGGWLDGASRRDIARNALVLVVPADREAPASLQALREPGWRRIALGKPETVPAGRYAQQALRSAGLWDVIPGRAVWADSVRQVLDYAARGEVDAGIVYRSDVRAAHGGVRVALTLDGHEPIVYPALVVADSRHKAQAQAFVAYLTGPRAAAVLARQGLGPP